MSMLLTSEGLSRFWGDVPLFENINITISRGDKVALVAANGTGKTTLLNILAGIDGSDSGSVKIAPDINVGYLKQNPVFEDELTVLSAIYGHNEGIPAIVRNYEEALLSEDETTIASAMSAMDQAGAWDFEARVKEVLTRLNLTRYDQPVTQMSGGQKKRLALAQVLIASPDLLIFDEPTNHLDLAMIEWLEQYLSRTEISLLMVTHDRYFLDRVCNVILEIDDAQLYVYRGNYSYFVEKRRERLAIMAAEIEKARNLMRKEQDWMSRQPQARATKAKYRIDAFYDLKDKASKRIGDDKVEIGITATRMGKKILELKHLFKSYGDLHLLNDFSYTFSRFEKIGIVGPNGAGKSTLLNIITGALEADKGETIVGETIKFGYFRQEGFKADETRKVLEVITDISEDISMGNGFRMSPLQFLNKFNFPPEMHNVQVNCLSGGEQRRLYLMTVLMQNPNFLILDEPTNDLDIPTLQILEEYLMDFDGCTIVVSHDRYFLDRIVDHLFVFRNEGDIKVFPGNYTQYRDALKAEEKVAVQAKTQNTKPKQTNSGTKRKLTYKEQKEMEAIELEMEQIEQKKDELMAIINSGSTDHTALKTASDQWAALSERLEEIEMRWLELSEI